MPRARPWTRSDDSRHVDARIGNGGNSGPYELHELPRARVGQTPPRGRSPRCRGRAPAHTAGRPACARTRGRADATLAKYDSPFWTCQLRSVSRIACRSSRPAVSARARLGRPVVVAAVERGIVAIDPDARVGDHEQRSDRGQSGTAVAPSAAVDPGVPRSPARPRHGRSERRGCDDDESRRRQEREHQVRRQIEHVRVADVVAVGEHALTRYAPATSSAPASARPGGRPVPARPAAVRSTPNCCRRSKAYIEAWSPSMPRGTCITIVSRQSDFVTSNHAVRSASTSPAGETAASHSVRRFHAYCSAPDAASRDRQRDHRAA